MIIQPKASEKEWFRWLENIQDWCISRQLWWGHRCPAYFIKINGGENDTADDKYWVAAEDETRAMEKAKAKFPNTEFTLEQGEDSCLLWGGEIFLK